MQSLRIGRRRIISWSLFRLWVVWLWYRLLHIQGWESYGLLPTRSLHFGLLWNLGIGWSGWRCGGLFRSQGWLSSLGDSCWLRVLPLLWYRSLPSLFQPPVRVNLDCLLQRSPLFPSVSCLEVYRPPSGVDYPLLAFCWLLLVDLSSPWMSLWPFLGIYIGISQVGVLKFRRQGTSLMTLLL